MRDKNDVSDKYILACSARGFFYWALCRYKSFGKKCRVLVCIMQYTLDGQAFTKVCLREFLVFREFAGLLGSSKPHA